ncbi:phage tail terminator protein [Paracidovorax valerianellae]|uniref:Uncharacterized protein n=1 Tax=Paracidovorax valerianellae TaxID=187868 RepID=A0A1G7EJP5_9BURK|nr:hypothetical protein [Paracidovorax valerianellae]MDA8446381.1 hypothetical protein [Paracidovorax valerianellae]SDE63854.1 hypothetical protein SAMN05192589_12348 [Paracidovorax valerianellae]
MSTQDQTVAEANDFMALEPRLVELVRQAVGGMSPAVHVLTSAEIADIKETAQRTPAVHVIYGGYRISDDIGIAWELTHTWYVVAAVKNVSTVRSGEAARKGAGVLAAHVVGALAGAQVQGATKPLTLISPPPARYSAGFQYLPSAILATTVFRKPQ